MSSEDKKLYKLPFKLKILPFEQNRFTNFSAEIIILIVRGKHQKSRERIAEIDGI